MCVVYFNNWLKKLSPYESTKNETSLFSSRAYIRVALESHVGTNDNVVIHSM